MRKALMLVLTLLAGCGGGGESGGGTSAPPPNRSIGGVVSLRLARAHTAHAGLALPSGFRSPRPRPEASSSGWSTMR